MQAATAHPIAQPAAGQPTTPTVATRTLTVTATYMLSEDGRKASLLTGGDGRAIQELRIEVPASRLHLVSVDANGVARLKLRPRYQMDGERGVTRVDAPPRYDAPPDLEELFREAARNHQLEEAFYVQRRTARSKRRDADRERRAQIAQAFLTDPTRRAIVHPAPTEKRCYLATEQGRVLFEADTDEVPARQVPAEAHRRFRADLRERKERNRQARAAQLAMHEEKKRFIAEWIADHGTPDQQARHAAGLLPIEEAVEVMTDHAFAATAHHPRYTRDGAARLQAHLRKYPQHADMVVTDADLRVFSSNAARATAAQWEALQQIKQCLPHATVILREHRLGSTRHPQAPTLTVISLLVTCTFGPFTLRREYAT